MTADDIFRHLEKCKCFPHPGGLLTGEIRTAVKEALDRYFADKIAVYWTVDDVLAACGWLTKEQALKVLQDVENDHQADVGINWDVIGDTAEGLYPRPAGWEPDEDGDEQEGGNG